MDSKTPIYVFCRIKPCHFDETSDVQEYSVSRGPDIDTLTICCQQINDVINHKPDCYKFKFSKVFDQCSRQEVIYETVANPVVQSALRGFNGTIFAYGQTGSGKTYTISGDKDNQGIVPRALFDIFSAIENVKNEKFDVKISYLEIYNEHSNDLLISTHEKKKISLRENSDKIMEWHNLSLCPVQTFSEAMELLIIGDNNRIVSDTPMNVYSSRSHTILTIYLTARVEETFEIRRAKLNLVDLAGSERVHKTGEEGIVLEEARHINLSLHYLEQVIVALSDSLRTHVPYRNCTMTSALRDSLGGNCMTVMVANIAIDKANIEETISTCRFAQRVALVRNELISNTERDLSGENSNLRAEIRLLRGQCSSLQAKVRELEKRNIKGSISPPEKEVAMPYQVEDNIISNSASISDQQLQTDIMYLVGWLQDELKASRTTDKYSCSILSTVESEEGFSNFINTTEAKEDWHRIKEIEQKTTEALKIKVNQINFVHQDMLNWWKRHENSSVKHALSGHKLNIPGCVSATNMISPNISPRCDMSVDSLLTTHSELLKDFQLLKSRLQSCKRNLERIKRKFLLEHNNWKKNGLAFSIDNPENLKALSGLNPCDLDVSKAMLKDPAIEVNNDELCNHLKSKNLKSNSEKYIKNYLKQCNWNNTNPTDGESFSFDESDFNTTIDDIDNSLFSTSTRLSDFRGASKYHYDTSTESRLVRSVPYSLHTSNNRIRSPLTHIEGTEELCKGNMYSAIPGLTTFNLTGEQDIDEEIISFYKNKCLSNYKAFNIILNATVAILLLMFKNKIKKSILLPES